MSVRNVRNGQVHGPLAKRIDASGYENHWIWIPKCMWNDPGMCSHCLLVLLPQFLLWQWIVKYLILFVVSLHTLRCQLLVLKRCSWKFDTWKSTLVSCTGWWSHDSETTELTCSVRTPLSSRFLYSILQVQIEGLKRRRERKKEHRCCTLTCDVRSPPLTQIKDLSKEDSYVFWGD